MYFRQLHIIEHNITITLIMTTVDSEHTNQPLGGRAWKGNYNIGKREGDYIYFDMVDFKNQKLMESALKFTYEDFCKLDIFKDYNSETGVMKQTFYLMKNRHTTSNVLQPMWRCMPLSDRSLTNILFGSVRGKVVCFRNGILYDYTRNNAYLMSKKEFDSLIDKPVTLPIDNPETVNA